MESACTNSRPTSDPAMETSLFCNCGCLKESPEPRVTRGSMAAQLRRIRSNLLWRCDVSFAVRALVPVCKWPMERAVTLKALKRVQSDGSELVFVYILQRFYLKLASCSCDKNLNFIINYEAKGFNRQLSSNFYKMRWETFIK